MDDKIKAYVKNNIRKTASAFGSLAKAQPSIISPLPQKQTLSKPSFGQQLRTGTANPLAQGLYNLPESLKITAQRIPGAINTMVMNPQQAGNLARTAPQYSQMKVPGLQAAANFSANYGQTFGQGLQNMAMGVDNIKNKPTAFGKVQGGAKLLKGAGQTMVPFNVASGLPFLVTNATTSLPQSKIPFFDNLQRFSAGVQHGIAQEGTLSPNIKAKNTINFNIGDNKISFDPTMGVGEMLGFVKNPVNANLFKMTEKVFPAGQLFKKNTNLIKWLSVTPLRGSVENILIDLAKVPENASREEKIKFMLGTAAMGAVSEVVGRGGMDAVSGAVNSKVGKMSQKYLADAFDELKNVYRLANVPVATNRWNNGERVVEPLWRAKVGQGMEFARKNEGFIRLGAEVGGGKPKVSAKSSSEGIIPQDQVPSTRFPQQQPRLSGGEQPPLEPPKQSKGGSAEIDPESSSNRIIGSVRDKINKVYTETLDRFHPLSSIANKAGEDVAMRRALSGHYGAGSTAQYHIDFELAPILKSTSVTELRRAAIALRDAELKQRGIKGSNTNELEELLKSGQLGKKNTEIGNALKKLYEYQDNIVKEYLVKTGIMSEKAFNDMKSKNQFYVPYRRVMDQVDEWLGTTPQKTGVGSVGSQNVINKIKGSDRDIQDPLESIIENTYKIVGLGKRQEVAKTLVSLRSKLPDGMIKQVYGTPLSSRDVISVFENGKVKKYRVPVEVAEAAKGMNQDQISTIVNILAAPTRLFRATATGLNPEFMLPNITRDLQSAFVNIGLNPLKFVSGLSHYMKRDDVYQEFLKSGGLTSQVSLDRPYLKKTVSEISSNKRGISVLKGGNLFTILAKIGQASEQPTRLAAFEKGLNDALKKGIPREQALKDAAYAAQESTVNFGRRGSKTQSINMIYAFMNARAQGTDRMIRSLKSNPKGASTRIGLLAIAPAIGLYAYNRTFQSYQDERIIPPYEKENNFIIMLSDEPISELGGAQYIKIPKGDIGKIANPIEAFMSFADNKGGDIQTSMLSALKAFIPINNAGDTIPTALRPIAENVANYSFFMKRPIVSDSKKDYPAKFQYNKNTSPIYKEIGEKLNISPAKVENLVRGYLTGFARIGEMMVKPFDKQNNYSGQDINQTPVARRFMGGAVRTEEEQALNDYYKQKGILDKVQSIKTGIKYGNIPVEDGINEINKLLENNQEELKTKNQSYVGIKDASASSENKSMNREIQESMVILNVEQTGKADRVGNKIIYQTDSGHGTIDLGKVKDLKGGNKYLDAIKQSEAFSLSDDILDADLTDEVKNQALSDIGISRDDAEYYSIASQSNDLKSIYLLEVAQAFVNQSGNRQEMIDLLASQRQKVNGHMIASDGVLDNLYSDGYITKEEQKALKDIDFDSEGKLKVKPASGGKKAKVIKPPVYKLSRKKRLQLKKPKIASIKLEGSKKLKTTKPKAFAPIKLVNSKK